MLKLGPLVGKRTWRVIAYGRAVTGRRLHHHSTGVFVLVRGRGLVVENYGTDPDIEVELGRTIRRGRDPQLEKAIAEA